MQLQGLHIGFAMTGSHCTIAKVLPQMAKLVESGADVIPIISDSVRITTSKYGTAGHLREEINRITHKYPWETLVEVEPVGPEQLLDLLVIMPCTGNTLAKISLGISDTPVTFACKAHLRNNRPVVIGISTNDALSANAANLGALLNRKHVYFIPFGQDNPFQKSNSLVFKPELLLNTIDAALNGKQYQPLILSWQ
ncbi:MAG: dipicolinate synthase subunit B [Bacillota bacterium]